MVAAALTERQKIVVQESVWTDRMNIPPVLHQSAAPATSATPRRWRPFSVIARARPAPVAIGRTKHVAWDTSGVPGMQRDMA